MFKWILVYIIVKNIVTGDLFMNNLYPVDDILCFKCEPGTFWNNHCKNNISKSECYPCPFGSYQSSYTVSSYCAPCTLCDHVVKNFELAKVLSTCTSKLDTECGCLDGLYLQKVSGSAREWFCKNVSMCRPGFEVKTKATNFTDTVCSPCLFGFYKHSFSLESCKPCTKNCSRGNEINSQCNSTHDTVCTEHNFKSNGPSDHLEMRTILGVVVPVVILVIICIAIRVILWFVRNWVNKGRDGSKVQLTFNGPGDQTDRNSDQISWIMSYKELNDWLKENQYDPEFEHLDASTLNDRLRVFYGCLRTKQGNEYSRSALVGIRSAISRHLNGPPFNRPFQLMTDRAFMTSNNVMLGLIKRLKRDGRDTSVHKKAISEGDIEKLYSSGVFDITSPETLQNKVFWDLMVNFGRRGQEGLAELKSTSYIKLTDDKGMQYYTMAYNECDKTHHGVDSKENLKDTRMYERPDDINCPVKSLDLYLSKLSVKCTALFQQPLLNPRQDCWYAAQPIGKNKISSWMSRLSKSANLSKQYTNHCIRATVATTLYRQGVDLLKIMSVTGHRNVKSLESYINDPTDHDRRTLSSKLQNATNPMPLAQTSNTENALTLSSTSVCSSDHAVGLEVSKEQMTNSAFNIMNNASITGGTFTFNIVQKDKM